jgi:hypothetical protein
MWQGQLLATRLVEGVPAALVQAQRQAQLKHGHCTTTVGVGSGTQEGNGDATSKCTDGANSSKISSSNNVAWVQVRVLYWCRACVCNSVLCQCVVIFALHQSVSSVITTFSC